MMYVIDVVLDSFSNLFRSHNYPPLEKIHSVFLFTAGLSIKGNEGKDQEVLQQRELGEVEERRG
jgi:hypothetical protein